MYALAHHIYFERRRLTVAGLLAFAGGFTLHSGVNAVVFGLPYPVFTGFLYAVPVVLTAIITTFLLPNLRWLTDSVAVSRLVFAVWVVCAHRQEIAAQPMVNATIIVGGAILLLRLSSWFDKLSKTVGAPAFVMNAAALTRSGLAWIDNTAMREGATNVGPTIMRTFTASKI